MADSASERLLQAAADGSLEGVEEALRQGADIDARREFGDTALNLAAEHGHKHVVQCLLDKGADIHNLGGADKTPIMNAAFAGNIGIVRLLLEKGRASPTTCSPACSSRSASSRRTPSRAWSGPRPWKPGSGSSTCSLRPGRSEANSLSVQSISYYF
jgi:ankyrin repeat protein